MRGMAWFDEAVLASHGIDLGALDRQMGMHGVKHPDMKRVHALFRAHGTLPLSHAGQV